MFLKNSRYAQSRIFDSDPEGRVDFRGIRPRDIPETPAVLEHGQTEGDRPDIMANNYYQADRAWWRIVDANPEFLIAGPIRDADNNRVTSGDGLQPERGVGDVMISDEMQGDAVLIPPKKG
ncbi:MAG: hypothetical protein AAFP87_06940 [Pseudomonadota bacterium]